MKNLKTKLYFLNSKKELFFVVAILVISLFVRLYKLGGDFHSIDSDRWFRRSVAFQEALLSGNFAQTYQKQHPGVTLMWLGGAGYKIAQVVHFKILGSGLDENVPSDFRIINFALKFPLVVVDMFLITLSYFLVRKLFNFKISIIYLTLLLTDSFFFFYNRQFHLDVLMSLLCLNSVLFLILFLKKQQYLDLILSSIICALAFLTKTPSIAILAGNITALILFNLLNKTKLKKLFIQLTLYSSVFLVIYLLVFPSNWVNPFETTRQIIVDSLTNTKEFNIHHLFNAPFSFLGFKYYYFVFLFRFSPLIMVLSLVALVTLVKNWLIKTWSLRKFLINHSKSEALKAVTKLFDLKAISIFLPFTGFIFLVILLYIDNKVYERYLVPFVPFLALTSSIFISNYLTEKRVFYSSILLTALFSLYTLNKAPNFASYASIIPENTQIKMFSEVTACDSLLYQIAQFLNEKEAGNEDYDVSMSGAYRLCLKPFMGARVNDFNNLKRPKYLILYWTDFEWLRDARIQREYNLIKTYKLDGMDVYYIYEKKLP